MHVVILGNEINLLRRQIFQIEIATKAEHWNEKRKHILQQLSWKWPLNTNDGIINLLENAIKTLSYITLTYCTISWNKLNWIKLNVPSNHTQLSYCKWRRRKISRHYVFALQMNFVWTYRVYFNWISFVYFESVDSHYTCL